MVRKKIRFVFVKGKKARFDQEKSDLFCVKLKKFGLLKKLDLFFWKVKKKMILLKRIKSIFVKLKKKVILSRKIRYVFYKIMRFWKESDLIWVK